MEHAPSRYYNSEQLPGIDFMEAAQGSSQFSSIHLSFLDAIANTLADVGNESTASSYSLPEINEAVAINSHQCIRDDSRKAQSASTPSSSNHNFRHHVNQRRKIESSTATDNTIESPVNTANDLSHDGLTLLDKLLNIRQLLNRAISDENDRRSSTNAITRVTRTQVKEKDFIEVVDVDSD